MVSVLRHSIENHSIIHVVTCISGHKYPYDRPLVYLINELSIRRVLTFVSALLQYSGEADKSTRVFSANWTKDEDISRCLR